jgi:hypothetical protein
MKGDFGYYETIPEEAREIFTWLCQDVVSLHEKWTLYKALFSDPEVIELLGYLAKETFRVIEESLRADMTMLIGRLCDPVMSFNHMNVSFKALLSSLPEIEGLPDRIDSFVGSCGSVDRHRNKRVAHNDQNTLIKPKENPLPGISRNMIDTIVKGAEEILHSVLSRYEDKDLTFELYANAGRADTFIFWLKKAKEYSDRERKERGY